MRKITLAASSIFYFLFPTYSYAAETSIQINRPQIGYSQIGDFINAAIRLAFIIAVVLVLAMLVWGAIEWIVSGGEKEAVGKARGKIINALIGLGILAVAFAVASLAGQFLGFNILGNLIIPTPTTPTPALPQ